MTAGQRRFVRLGGVVGVRERAAFSAELRAAVAGAPRADDPDGLLAATLDTGLEEGFVRGAEALAEEYARRNPDAGRWLIERARAMRAELQDARWALLEDR